MFSNTQRFAVLISALIILLALTTGLTLAKDRPAGFSEIWQVSEALSTGFTYQGQLTDGGAPAEGSFDFQFELYDAETAGSLIGTVALEDVTVANGTFTVSLDFGQGAFDGQARWLAIGVRPGAETGAYTPLTPRQSVTAVPYAQYASDAGQLGGQPPSAYQARVSGTCAPGSMIRVIHADGSVTCQPDAPLNRNLAPTDNLITIVDNNTYGGTGMHTSITIGADGLPIISHTDPSNDDLKVAHCNDTACASASITVVDTDGRESSIAIGADGLPIISYMDWANTDLKVAHCEDAVCTSAILTTLDEPGIIGDSSSITIGADGLPIISYSGSPWGGFADLKVAHCNNLACTSANITAVDTTASAVNTSIAIGTDGLPVISYWAWGSDNLSVAHCADAACSSATLTIVDGSGTVRGNTAITIGADGLPIISYRAGTNDDLKVAHCNNLACTSASIATVDTLGHEDYGISITIGADGLPIISYSISPVAVDADLKVAHCNDLACANASIVAVDTNEDVGSYNAITIGVDGLPVISYFDRQNTDLKVIHCSNPFCVPYFRRR